MKNIETINIRNICENEVIRKESGITLVALIVTIVVLIILAAVSITGVLQMKIVEITINGTEKYSKEQIKEEKDMQDISNILEDALGKAEVTELVYEIGKEIEEEKIKNNGNISDEKLAAILNKYGKLEGEGTNIRDKILLTTKGEHKIKVENILNRNSNRRR